MRVATIDSTFFNGGGGREVNQIDLINKGVEIFDFNI